MGILAFLAVLGAGLAVLPPSLVPADGDLIAAAWAWDFSAPRLTAPLFAFHRLAFALIPAGSPAFRVNIACLILLAVQMNLLQRILNAAFSRSTVALPLFDQMETERWASTAAWLGAFCWMGISLWRLKIFLHPAAALTMTLVFSLILLLLPVFFRSIEGRAAARNLWLAAFAAGIVSCASAAAPGWIALLLAAVMFTGRRMSSQGRWDGFFTRYGASLILFTAGFSGALATPFLGNDSWTMAVKNISARQKILSQILPALPAPGNSILILSAAVLLTAASILLFKTGARRHRHRWPLAFCAALFLAFAAAQPSRGDFRVLDSGTSLLRAVAPGGVIASPQQAESLLYALKGLQKRADVVLYFPDDSSFKRSALKEFPANVSTASLYSDDAAAFLNLPGLSAPPQPDRDLIPVGPALRWVPDWPARLVAPAAQLSLSALAFWWSIERGNGPLLASGAEARLRTARAFILPGSPDNAEFHALSALRDAPLSAKPYALLGTIAQETGRLPRAASWLKRASSLSPRNADLMAAWGRAALSAGDRPGAQKAFDRALDLNPMHREALGSKAKLLEDAGDFSGALPLRLRISGMAPQDKEARWNLIFCLESLGRKEEMLRELDAYEKLALSKEERLRAEARRPAPATDEADTETKAAVEEEEKPEE